ncbi:MAG: hypothetical protein KDB07_06025 [Planctomycetes bacterium]|nr:hypothetical protein [Planctomycetota bacterium]
MLPLKYLLAIRTEFVSRKPLDVEAFYAFRAAIEDSSVTLSVVPNMLELLRDPRADEFLKPLQLFT